MACFPERPLASYGEPNAAPPDVTRGRGSSLPDASAREAGEGGQTFDAEPSVDAGVGPGAVLVCREECTCDRSDSGEFMFCTSPVSHGEAVARCALAGGSLPSVDDPERNAWLSARMLALDADDFWLSGTDSENEGVWRWSDGRVFFESGTDAGTLGPYAPWEAGQPNDLDGEDCMRSTGGVWRDLDCSEALAFVCQG